MIKLSLCTIAMRRCALFDVRESITDRCQSVKAGGLEVKWPLKQAEEAGRASSALALLLFSLFVMVPFEYMFNFRKEGPPLFMRQGTRGGSRERRGLANRRWCNLAGCYSLDVTRLGLFCGGFWGRGGCWCWSRSGASAIGDCRGILSALQRMIGFRYRGL